MNILVAMSGGVDSSVTAALLVEAGHQVTGVTMKLWGGESDSGCCSVSDVDDARRVADQLGIDHHVFNFGDEFEEHVVGPYVDAHRHGVTPNPCIECNRHLKFDKLLRRADALGFEHVATGHHARIVTVVDGTWRVARGADPKKDQSYVLYMLDQQQLARTMLPIGHLTKAAVREHAQRIGLRTASKPDSQDVCFITAVGGREQFLGSRIPLRPARLVDTTGAEVGHVDSIELITIGQRKGLDAAGGEGRRYVIDTDPAQGRVTIGSLDDLMQSSLRVGDVVWASPSASAPPAGEVLAQVSAHGQPLPATIAIDDDATVRITFATPQRRVAPGQSVVFYDGETVRGGGIALRDAR